jgi:hypothetical protein
MERILDRHERVLVQRRVSLAGVAVDHWVQVVGSAR